MGVPFIDDYISTSEQVLYLCYRPTRTDICGHFMSEIFLLRLWKEVIGHLNVLACAILNNIVFHILQNEKSGGKLAPVNWPLNTCIVTSPFLAC